MGIAARLTVSRTLSSSIVAALLAVSGAASVSAGPGAVHPAAVDSLRVEAGADAVVRLDVVSGAVGFLRVPPGRVALGKDDPVERAMEFLERYRSAFGIGDPAVELDRTQVASDRYGHTRVVFGQRHAGLPVFGAQLRVHFDDAGELIAAHGTWLPRIDVDPAPTLLPRDAAGEALAEIRHRLKRPPAVPLTNGTPRLTVFRPGLARRSADRPRLAWEVEIGNGADVREQVWVDAHDGTILDVITRIRHTLTREIHQPNLEQPIWAEGETLPYASGDATNDLQVNGLIDHAGAVYQLFWNLSGGAHPSWDGLSGTMTSIWKPWWMQCPNATWNGTTANFCDGVASDDVIAHEWVHAYTERTHDLIYQAQPGALNESYSDIFGELVDLLNGAGTDAPGNARAAAECSVYGGAPQPGFAVHAPASLVGPYTAASAGFNPVGDLEVDGALELVFDNQTNGGTTSATDGCEPLVGFTAGRIAMIDRGACAFGTKALNAQAAGAIAVVVVNSTDATFSMGGSAPGLTIPAVMIGQSHGNLFKAEFPGAVQLTITTSQATDDSYRWLIGEDAFAIGPIRDLWNPTCFGSPGKVSDAQYRCGAADAQGVHSNSGVPNHAFALLVDGGTYNGVTVGTIGAVKAAHLYWRAMSTYQVPDSDFADHALALDQACADLVGVELTDPVSGAPSGLSLSASDCDQVAAASTAVELTVEPACNDAPLLAPNPSPLACGSALLSDRFETDPAARWIFSNQGVFPEYEPRDWEWTPDVPPGGDGGALFADDGRRIGDCISGFGDQSRQLSVDSPTVNLDGSAVLSFNHYVATEFPADGGNVKVSVNGAPFVVVDPAHFQLNPYNTTLAPPSAINANPLAGQPGFSGSDSGTVTGSWGQSRINLAPYAGAGDSVIVRFDFGADGCSGLDGWYVDDVFVCTAAVTAGRIPDGYRLPGNPLQVDKADGGLTLDWSPSCHGADEDYAVYEGIIGSFDTHFPRQCSTGGATHATADLGPGSFYYLVVPLNGEREGSYGTNSDGAERFQGIATCKPQAPFAPCELAVEPSSHRPVITSEPATLLADHNRPWEYVIEVDDADDDPITISFDFKPTWMTFDELTRTLSGTAGWDHVGTHAIRLRASDGALEDVQGFEVTVQKGEILCDQPFGDPAESLFVLPFPVGETYRVIQPHCPSNPAWGHHNWFAADWSLDIGDPVIASRAGTVIAVREFNQDHNGGCGLGNENWVFIQHADGTVMQYVHLTLNGALVQIGQHVTQGQTIAISGNTGCSSGPHLHTALFRDSTDYSRKATLPVNYRNADGPLDANNAPILGGDYTALPFTPDDR